MLRRLLLAFAALVALAAPASAGTSTPTSYNTAADIVCASDAVCRGIYRVEIRQHIVAGVTGTTWATWATDTGLPGGATAACPGTVDGLLYIRPGLGVGCFVVSPPLITLSATPSTAGIFWGSALDTESATPPLSPTNYMRVLVDPVASGAFAGHDNQGAWYLDGTWVFFTPKANQIVTIADSGAVLQLQP